MSLCSYFGEGVGLIVGFLLYVVQFWYSGGVLVCPQLTIGLGGCIYRKKVLGNENSVQVSTSTSFA